MSALDDIRRSVAESQKLDAGVKLVVTAFLQAAGPAAAETLAPTVVRGAEQVCGGRWGIGGDERGRGPFRRPGGGDAGIAGAGNAAGSGSARVQVAATRNDGGCRRRFRWWRSCWSRRCEFPTRVRTPGCPLRYSRNFPKNVLFIWRLPRQV